MTTRWITVNGATLHAEADGAEDVPAVLLWSGARCTVRMWDRVVPRLTERFRAIRFDVRGTGSSSPAADSSQYALDVYAKDANRVLDAFGVAHCHIWGMAWGSRAALAYCLLHPERALSVALYDASIATPDPDAQREGARRALERQTAAGIPRFDRPAGWREHAHPDAVPAAMAAAARFDFEGAPPRVNAPMLVATGDHDPNLPSSRDIAASAPNAQLVVFEHVGHGSVLQRPDLAVETFLDFHRGL